MTVFDIGRRRLLQVAGAGILYSGLSSVPVGATRDGAVSNQKNSVWSDLIIEGEDGQPIVVDSERQLPELRQEHGLTPGLSATSIGDGDAGSQSQHIDVGIAVSAPDRTDRGNVPSDATLTISAGAIDTSGQPWTGVSGESLTVVVQNQSVGESDEFTVQTESDGTVVLEYDLVEENAEEGQYSVTVTHGNGNTTGVSFYVGTFVEATSTVFAPIIFVGEEATFAFLARDGVSSVSGYELDLAVTKDGQTVTETTTTTDSDGFASISFTPGERGQYQIQASRDGGVVAATTATAGQVVCGGTFDLQRTVAGEESIYGGYLKDADGFLPNEEFQLRFVDGTETYLDRTVTTNDAGFFGITYTLTEITEETNLRVEVELSDGSLIPVRHSPISVDTFDDDDETGPQVLDLDTDRFSYAPGDEVEVVVEAELDGSAVTNESVPLYFRYGFNGPLAHWETVTTDENGEATTTFTLPENVPEGTTLSGDALLEANGEEYTDGSFARIRSTSILFGNSAIEPGAQATFEIEAIDPGTGDPIEGVPQQVDLLYGAEKTGSIETVSMTTGSDGVGEATVSIPDDVSYELGANYFNRSASGSFIRTLAPQFPGSLSATVQGRDIELTFDTPDGTTAQGIVFASTFAGGVSNTLGAKISSDGTVTVQVPDYISNEFFDFKLWAADESGQLYNGFTTAEFQGEGEGVNVSTSPDSVELTTGSEATVDLAISGATEDVGSYKMTIQSGDTSVLEITDVTLNGTPADSTVDLTDDGVQAVLNVDMGNNPFTSDSPTVAQLTVASGEAGQTDLSLSAASVSNANFEEYTVLSTSGTSVTVTETVPTIVGDDPVRDLNGDGLYRDIDGDGQLTLDDVLGLYNNLRSDAVQNNTELFNFDGGDTNEVTIGDVQALFEYVQQNGGGSATAEFDALGNE